MVSDTAINGALPMTTMIVMIQGTITLADAIKNMGAITSVNLLKTMIGVYQAKALSQASSRSTPPSSPSAATRVTRPSLT
jgi:hypothetical protein